MVELGKLPMQKMPKPDVNYSRKRRRNTDGTRFRAEVDLLTRILDMSKKQNKLLRHEALDRCHVILCTIEDHRRATLSLREILK